MFKGENTKKFLQKRYDIIKYMFHSCVYILRDIAWFGAVLFGAKLSGAPLSHATKCNPHAMKEIQNRSIDQLESKNNLNVKDTSLQLGPEAYDQKKSAAKENPSCGFRVGGFIGRISTRTSSSCGCERRDSFY